MDESIEVTSLGNMLSICLFWGEFELWYAYKLYAYKTSSEQITEVMSQAAKEPQQDETTNT